MSLYEIVFEQVKKKVKTNNTEIIEFIAKIITEIIDDEKLDVELRDYFVKKLGLDKMLAKVEIKTMK